MIGSKFQLEPVTVHPYYQVSKKSATLLLVQELNISHGRRKEYELKKEDTKKS